MCRQEPGRGCEGASAPLGIPIWDHGTLEQAQLSSVRHAVQALVTTQRADTSRTPSARLRYCRPLAWSASHRDTYMGTSTVDMKAT